MRMHWDHLLTCFIEVDALQELGSPEEIHQAFGILDANGDGVLSAEELLSMLTDDSTGEAMTPRSAKRVRRQHRLRTPVGRPLSRFLHLCRHPRGWTVPELHSACLIFQHLLAAVSAGPFRSLWAYQRLLWIFLSFLCPDSFEPSRAKRFVKLHESDETKI